MLPSDWETEQEMADRLLATGHALTEAELADLLGLAAMLPDLEHPEPADGSGTRPRPPRTR